jgi:superfamily II DNA/RNA helicase
MLSFSILGTNKDTEEAKLKEGCSMVVGTPGRLIDHMRNTKGWKFKVFNDAVSVFLSFLLTFF